MTIAVFVASHQDDETLTLGSAIRYHIEAGVEVHTLLLTDGSGSGAQAVTGLSDADFIEARDYEFVRACAALGVKRRNVHIPTDRAQAGQLTPSVAAGLINDFLAMHPDASVKTHTDQALAGRHTDHVAAGAGLRLLYNESLTAAPRFYVEPYHKPAFVSAHPTLTVSPSRTSASGVLKVRSAYDVYAEVDHPGGKYGIGYISVPTYFNSTRTDPVNWWHLP